MLDSFIKAKKKKTTPIYKIFLTIALLLIFRIGNTIPIPGIDQEIVKNALNNLEGNNPIFQRISMSSGKGNNRLTPFLLGIVPFINASIIIDLLTASFPYFEKIESEDSDFLRKKLVFYKKSLALIFSVIQSFILLNCIRPYFYNRDLLTLGFNCALLVAGSMSAIWLTTLIDSNGIGNGISLIILTNIVTTFLEKQAMLMEGVFNSKTLLEIFVLFFLIVFICISQTSRITIEVVSARQLAFLENTEIPSINTKIARKYRLNENGLSIRLNQAGIFPLIIASNIFPIVIYFFEKFVELSPLFQKFIYYSLVIGFNYFYTILFWDPEKIAEQLRKASVSIRNISPGQETISYLEKVAQSSSIIGGIFLCSILFCYDLLRQFINGSLLNQINVSSLIIVVGVAYEIQKAIRALYKNNPKDIY